MLADWYFCCCIGNTPLRAAAFLAILETFENPEADAVLLGLAYEQLEKCESWERVYALPHVLRRRRERSDLADLPGLERYLRSIVDVVGSDCAEAFDKLIDAVLHDLTGAEFARIVCKCAAQIDSVPRSKSSTPYLDLAQFVPHSVLMAVVADRARSDASFALIVGTEDDDVGVTLMTSPQATQIAAPVDRKGLSVAEFRDLSARGEFGRLCMRLGALTDQAVESSRGASGPELAMRITARLWTGCPAVAKFEPDLVSTVAELWFEAGALSDQARTDGARRAARESLTLERWTALLREVPRAYRAGATIVADTTLATAEVVLQRFGLELSEEISCALPIVWWQLSLWELATRLDPRVTAEELVPYWRWPRDLFDELVCFAPDRECARWEDQLRDLLVLMPPSVTRVRVLPAKQYEIPVRARALFSPWIEWQWPTKFKREYLAQGVAATTRLLVVGTIAVRILQTLAEKNRYRRELAALLIHASDFMFCSYNRWITKYTAPREQDEQQVDAVAEEQEVLSSPFGGLLLFARRQVDLAGQAELVSIPPDLFVDLLKTKVDDPTIPSADFVTDCAIDAILPGWVARSWRQAVDGSGPARWLPLLGELYHRYREKNHHTPYVINTALLLRFVLPDCYRGMQNPREFDWLARGQNRDKQGAFIQWNQTYRQLLLTNENYGIAEWWKPYWIEPEWDHPKNATSEMRQRRLVRAIERVACMSRQTILPPEWPTAEGDKWWAEWRECLNGIQSERDMDQFVQMRLVQMLRDGSVTAADDQELVALLILEYGRLLALQEMLRVVFPVSGETNHVRSEVQESLLRAIHRFLELELDDADNATELQDPWVLRNDRRRNEMLRQLLLRLASEHSETESVLRLKEVLQRLVSDALPRPVDGELRTVVMDADAPDQLQAFESSLVDAAVYNEDSNQISLVLDDLSPSRVRNLFQESREDVVRLLDDGAPDGIDVLAVIVNSFRREGRQYVAFNCGLPRYLHGVYDKPMEYPVGSWVELSIRSSISEAGVEQRGRRLQWEVNERKSPRRLRSRRLSNVLLTERDDPYRLVAKLHLQVCGEWRDIAFDPHQWDPDLSRAYYPIIPERGVTVVARLGDGLQKNHWVPLDRDCIQLVLDEMHGRGRLFAVLTLIERLSRGTYGEVAYRFSARPGINYLLDRRDFHDVDAAELDAAIDHEDDPEGLLVAITTEGHESGRSHARLALLKRDNQEIESERYPELHIPFDDRNLRWKRLLTGGQIIEAQRASFEDREGWSYEVDPPSPGFPRSLQLAFSPTRRPAYDARQAQFKLDQQWNTPREWQTRVIDTRYLGGQKLRVDRRDFRRFLSSWIKPGRGQRIELEMALDLVDEARGRIRCVTPENVKVHVDAESLTMRWISGGHYSFDSSRQAEITFVGGDDTEYEIQADLIDMPEGRPDEIYGIVFESPDPKGGGTLYQILWDVPEPSLGAVNIHDAGELRRIDQGSVLHARKVDSRWIVTVRSRFVQARALWKIVEEAKSGAQADLCYLGTVWHRGELRAIAENLPGELVLLARPRPDLDWLESVADEAEGESFGGRGLNSKIALKNLNINGRGWIWDKRTHYRAVLSCSGDLIVGNCVYETGTSGVREVSVAEIQLQLTTFEENLGILQRTLVLRPWTRERPRKDIRLPSIAEPQEDWSGRLNSYLAVPARERPRIDAIFDGQLITLQRINDSLAARNDLNLCPIRVPASHAEGFAWTSTARIGELACVANAPYAREETETGRRQDLCCVAITQPAEGCIELSFRAVRPYDVDEYRGLLQQTTAVEYGQEVTLPSPLYYVGCEYTDPLTREPYPNNEAHHRFEWGCGKMLVVPEHRLQYKGQPFIRANLLLYHGDSLGLVMFLPERQASDDSNTSEDDSQPLGGTVLSIEDALIRFSPARQLRHQREHFRMLHMLHIELRNESVRIASVTGLEERRADGDIRKSFSSDGFTLTRESELRVLPRLRALESKLSSESSGELAGHRRRLMVLGRFDVDTFDRTRGRTIRYHHVRLTFDESGRPEREEGQEADPSPDSVPWVQDGETLLMTGGIIKQLRNDLGLVVKPLTLDDADIGDDFPSELLILRRMFSVREDLLRRIYNDDKTGPTYFEEKILLVALNRDERWERRTESSEAIRRQDSRIFSASMKHLPSRASEALSAAFSGDLPFATVATAFDPAEDKGSLRLELRPGFFIQISGTRLKDCPALSAGDIVRIERIGVALLRVINAGYSDHHYIGRGRAIVALPRDDVVRAWTEPVENPEVAAFWRHKRPFVIGGLANLTPTLGSYSPNDGRWNSSICPQDCIGMMSVPHPKVAWLGFSHRGVLLLSPSIPDCFIGRLALESESWEVRYCPVHQQGNHASEIALEWRFLTYGDESAANVVARCKRERWRYHDRRTAYWEKGPRIETENLEDHCVLAGTTTHGGVFFEHSGEQLRLRYDPNSFLEFGFPIEELLQSLRSKPGQAASYFVAGVAPEGGLWIELAPGRISNIPPQRFVHRVLGTELPLAQFHWEGIAPGDLIRLSLSSRDPLKPDAIAIESWNPGSRNALGSSRCLLPVADRDRKNGAMTLGAGAFTVVLPMTQPHLPGNTIILRPDNSMEDLPPDALPRRDDVVLLGLDGKRLPIVIGIDGFKPMPVADFRGDPLQWEVHHALPDLIEAVGGALPVTVDATAPRQSILYFSRRAQEALSRLPDKTVTLATVLGFSKAHQQLLLRCGSGIVKADVNRIIPGIPRAHYAAAASVLKQRRVSLWLRGGPGGTIQSGIVDAVSPEFPARAVAVVGSDDQATGTNSETCGLICRASDTLALHWLPEPEVSWATLDVKQLEQLFVDLDPPPSFLVKGHPSGRMGGPVSINRTRKAAKEFDNLCVGKQLAVRISARGDQDAATARPWLVQSFVTGVLLECEPPRNASLTAKDVRVEVTRRDRGSRRTVRVVLPHEKQFKIDLPLRYFKALGHNNTAAGAEPKVVSSWRDVQSIDLAAACREAPTAVADDRLLFMAFRTAFPDGTVLDRGGDRVQNGDVALLAKVANGWMNAYNTGRQREGTSSVELDAACGIMAILLLDNLGHRDDPEGVRRWRRLARELLWDLGRRAIRSIHAEVLSHQWVYNSQNREIESGPWQRLNRRILSSFRQYVDGATLREIRRFSRSVILRQNIDLEDIAVALIAATGQLAPMLYIARSCDCASVATTLRDVSRTLPPSSFAPSLAASHLMRLSGALKTIIREGRQVILLPPLKLRSGSVVEPSPRPRV